VTSIAFYRRCALGPLPSSSRCPSPSRSRRTIHCHRGAVVLSLAIKELSRRPLPLRSRRAIPRRHGAIGRVDGPPSQWPESSPTFVTRHVPPRPRLRLVRRLPSASASHCGIAFRASHPSGWLSRLLASHAATSHLPVPPPLITLSPLITPLLGLLSGWLRHHLSSRHRHQSAGSSKSVSRAV